MVILNEKDILNLMNGAGLLASGGGGAVKDGQNLLNVFKENNPDVPIEVKMIDVSEMEEGKYSTILAGLGAPTKVGNQDFTLCATGSFDEIHKIAAEEGKELEYIMAVEMGGFNTFAPMLISLANGNPVIDADCAGRAVPGLETLLTNVNGYDTSPVALSDSEDNRIQIKTKDPKNALLVQSIAGVIADQIFVGIAGITGWLLNKEQIEAGIPTGTVTLAKEIGALMAAAAHKTQEDDYVDEIFAKINDAGIAQARALTKPSKIREYTQSTNNGFDIGHYLIGDETNGTYHVYYQNESLVVYSVDADGNETAYMTAPDIIAMYDAKTATAITNEDIYEMDEAGTLEDFEVVLGVIKVNDKWWLSENATAEAWKPYLENVGYTGEIIRFKEVE